MSEYPYLCAGVSHRPYPGRYDGWSAWTVSVHDERGCLVETVPFPKNVDTSDALCPEGGINSWPQRSPATLHPTGSTRYH